MALRIVRYQEESRAAWDALVARSRNGTFLFRRDYMDYHRDRFCDHSLMIYGDRGDDLLALLPANRQDGRLISHGGLTYGGFVIDEHATAATMLQVVGETLAGLRREGFDEVVLKLVPHIYHRSPCGDAEYALFRHGAALYRRDVTTTVIPAQRPKWQERRMRGVRKARSAGVTIARSDDYAQYWPILEENLRTVHDLRPVHSLDEIRCLAGRFPGNISLFAAFLDGRMVAGTVVYETDTVAHAQYTASASAGRTNGALDLLFFHLLTDVFAAKPYFDFGVSTEDEGRWLNEGLVAFKEGFGGGTITHDFYRVVLG